MRLWKELVQTDVSFQTAVNLRLDRENVQKFTGYIPTASSVALIERFLDNILAVKGKSASILIGPYGKGKSHLLLVLLAMLEQRYPGEQELVMQRLADISPRCGAHAHRVLERGPFLTVLVSNTGNSMNTSFLLAAKEALERNNLQELMPESYYGEALLQIKRWETDYPDTCRQLEELLENGQIEGMPGCIEELREALEHYDESALMLFRRLYPKLTAGSRFEPMINMDASVLLQQINHKLCRDYGYQGIYVVFDEFSKYLEGHTQTGAGADMKVLQDMCELANAAQTDPFFITFVAHKSLREYNSRLSREVRNQLHGIEGRLQECLFVASARNHFNLIGSVLKKTAEFKDFFPELLRGEATADLLARTYELPFFHAQFQWEEFLRVAVENSYPMTPFSALLLWNMSEKVAQNERTLFTYLTADEQGSVCRLLKGEGGKDQSFLGTDHIYDYFAPALREMTEETEIHNEWLKTEYALRQTQDAMQAGILKTIAVLHMAVDWQETPVNDTNIWLALGGTLCEVKEGITALLECNLLVWRSKTGCYTFKNNIGVNLEEELQTAMQKIPDHLNLDRQLEEISDLEYVLPKSYNHAFTITRYFQYIFMRPEVLYQTLKPSYLFEEKFADGKIIALVGMEPIETSRVLEQSRRWQDARILILIPHDIFGQEGQLRKYLAVQELLRKPHFIEDNRVLEQELHLYAEDLLYEINAELEREYLPQNHNCTVVWNGRSWRFQSEKEFNTFLSDICGSFYNFSPRVNHELLNISNVTGQYLKARSHIVDEILQGGSMEHYERGTGPEAMVYRTALVRTGLRGNRYPLDEGTGHILQEIHSFINQSASTKQCFAILYERLQGKEYGVRKGLLPLFLAIELTSVAGIPILYLQSKEVLCDAGILNNINDKPEQYYLYLEQVDGEKEAYLSWLEDYFSIEKRGAGRQERFQAITEAMQRRYRAFPKVVSNWKQLDEQEWEAAIRKSGLQVSQMQEFARKLQETSEKLMAGLRKLDLNPREILFERIPRFLDREQGDLFCAQAVGIIYTVWGKRLEWIQRQIAQECLVLCGADAGESLTAHLKSRYRSVQERLHKLVLSTQARRLCVCLEKLESYREEDAASDVAYAITGIHMEDWTPETVEVFRKSFVKALEEINSSAQELEKNYPGRKIMFTDRKGNPVERYFREEKSGVGDFLKNAIKEALEEFGDSMEPAQKAAVLVETLEELLG